MELTTRRTAGSLLAATALLALALPAQAGPKGDDGGHKMPLCHVTNSANNEYVLIEVDRRAFDGHGKSDHMHHKNKNNNVDREPVDGACDFDVPPPPDGPGDPPDQE